ncbi:NUDIX hydrolase domain-like protein [Mycena galericulata]|nr:NUDIX hydrolase domain-like protein [Mycena galericulata]
MSDKAAPKPLNLLQYHRPERIRLTDPRIPPLSAESKRCLRNLATYRAHRQKFPYPRSRSAAVIVALFVGRMGDLHVVLNRRSASLRTYAGDTTLPGGKVEAEDRTIEDTARREAFEEIGLPLDKMKVPLLCILEPFLAANQLIVTPVVVLILDNTLRPILNTTEVASLFSHPLAAFMSSSPPFPTESELVEVPYHTAKDFVYTDTDGITRIYRLHRFLTGREAGGVKPLFGLTASILIEAACIAHAPRLPDFEVAPPHSQTRQQRIASAILSSPTFREAYDTERLHVDWAVIGKVASTVKTRTAPGGRGQPKPRSKL